MDRQVNKSNDIALAQWALISEFRSGEWKTLDFPRIAREDFSLNGVELVNTLFEVPTEAYLRQLKANASDVGVDLLLIMCDDEGDGAAVDKQDRLQFVINHRKWVDIAHYLGCHSIRTNCRGNVNESREDSLARSADTYHQLLDYASGAGINILIENHGGLSDDPDWLVALVQRVNHPLFGTYPDWREPKVGFDNYRYLEKTLPFAKGMSFRVQPEDAMTVDMIRLCQSSGYTGWYGIESDGREAVRKGIDILKKQL